MEEFLRLRELDVQIFQVFTPVLKFPFQLLGLNVEVAFDITLGLIGSWS